MCQSTGRIDGFAFLLLFIPCWRLWQCWLVPCYLWLIWEWNSCVLCSSNAPRCASKLLKTKWFCSVFSLNYCNVLLCLQWAQASNIHALESCAICLLLQSCSSWFGFSRPLTLQTGRATENSVGSLFVVSVSLMLATLCFYLVTISRYPRLSYNAAFVSLTGRCATFPSFMVLGFDVHEIPTLFGLRPIFIIGHPALLNIASGVFLHAGLLGWSFCLLPLVSLLALLVSADKFSWLG